MARKKTKSSEEVATESEGQEVLSLLELRAQHLEDIREASKEADRLAMAYEEAKESARSARDRMEAANANLRALIREDPSQRKLFTDDDTDETKHDWRVIAIENVPGMPSAAVKALRNANIKTIGSLADYTAENAIQSVKGIGNAAAEKLQDALTKFWEANPDYA